MINYKLNNKLWTTLILCLLLNISMISATPELTCEISNSPTTLTDSIKVYSIYNYTNSHAEIYSENNYNYNISCNAIDETTTINLNNNCDSNGYNILDLYSDTNAHAEKGNLVGGSYSSQICLSTTTTGYYITCDYINAPTDCSTAGYQTCLGTISSDTNAHIANCNTGDAYETSICCNISAGTAPAIIPSTPTTLAFTDNVLKKAILNYISYPHSRKLDITSIKNMIACSLNAASTDCSETLLQKDIQIINSLPDSILPNL